MRYCVGGTILLASLLISGQILAADIIVYNRDMYDRITFDSVPSGDITEAENKLTLPLAGGLSDEEKRQILSQSKGLKDITFADERVTLSFNAAVSDTQFFRIGGKVILDIFLDSEKLAAVTAPKADPKDKTPEKSEGLPAETKNTDQTPPEKLVEKEKVKADAETDSPPTTATPAVVPTGADQTPVPTATQASQPQTLQEVPHEETPQLKTAETLPELANPTVVNISSTTPFGLSVFQRLGRLFVVTDQVNMAIPPQLSGHGADLGWAMTEIPMDNGKAWMMPLPQGSYLRPEGRGLVWRVVISDSDPQLKTADIRRRLTDPTNPSVDIMMPNAATLLKLTDPDYGDDLAVATATRATSRMDEAYDFVDFDILPAVIGVVVKPETDGLRIQAGMQYISITGKSGLSLAADSENEIVKNYMNDATARLSEDRKVRTTLDRIYYFTDWGGTIPPEDFRERRKELDRFLAMAQPGKKLGVLLDMVKLTLSQGMGQEALGYLNIARDTNPQIEQASEYQALRGAAHFLAGQYDLAAKYFNGGGLNNISEAYLWQAATLAALGEEEKAQQSYRDNAILTTVYPYEIKRKVLAPLALAMLNQGRGQDALPLIDLLDQNNNTLSSEDKATLAYLKGRAQSVTGHPDEGISNLYKASMGDKLGPYGIRSELLLIEDELAREVIKPDEALKRMERLRFAWRGDHLETEIQIALGNLYIKNGQPRQGLNVLKRAAANTQSVTQRRSIVRTMADAYKSIFIGDAFNDLDPLIAVTVYDEFKELTPVGDEGNALIDRLADKLMGMGLMSRATEVLADKMDRLGGGQDAIKTGLRIASINLLDSEPQAALQTLKKVDTMISAYRGDDKDDLNQRVVLLKARALSDSGQPQQALFMTEGLNDTDDVVKLRVDTAWRSGNWVAVTDNLSKLLARQDITAAQPPTEEQGQLILNQAVALSLSDQYDALQRFAAQYDLAMKQTPLYKTFLVVTRPQNISNLADRETLLNVTSEVDLFQGVLKREK